MTLQEKIESAFYSKELFFKPWIGEKYEHGILLNGDEKRRKVLIVGASRYCRAVNKEKDICPHKGSCLEIASYDKLSDIKSPCSFVKGKFCDINTECILEHINAKKIGNSYWSYRKFEKEIMEYSDCNTKEKLWNHISFINYLQCITESVKTPSRSSSEKNVALFDDSRVIVEKIVSLLCPDIIILWGSSTFYRNMNINSKTESSCSRLFFDCTKIEEWIYKIKIEDISYPLLLTNHHPADFTFCLDGKVFDSFVKHVRGCYSGF